MVLRKELTALASCSGRIDDADNPAFLAFRSRSRSRNCLTARFFTNSVTCRILRAAVTNGANTVYMREREWRITATTFNGSANFQRFYATCEKGLEDILAVELSSPNINASQVEIGVGGVAFAGNQTTGYNANLWLRTGDRVLCELAHGLLPESGSGIYDFVTAAADWPSLLSNCTPRISQSATCYKFRKFAIQTRLLNFDEAHASVSASVSNAILDSLRGSCGQRWPDWEDAVTVLLYLHVDTDSAVLYMDMSGTSLYKRGYGDTVAPSKEGLAAAVLTIAGWNPSVPGLGEANKNAAQGVDHRVLLDPFCGTGSFLIQAALMASNVAPGLMRRQWPFQSWRDFDENSWTECRDTAASIQVSTVSGTRLIGNDMNDGVIAKCKKFARAAGALHLLELSSETSRHYRPPCTPTLVVTNPPCAAPLTYSSLRGEDERLLTLWQGFGHFLRSQCQGLMSISSPTTASLLRPCTWFPIASGSCRCRVGNGLIGGLRKQASALRNARFFISMYSLGVLKPQTPHCQLARFRHCLPNLSGYENTRSLQMEDGVMKFVFSMK